MIPSSKDEEECPTHLKLDQNFGKSVASSTMTFDKGGAE